MTKCPYIVGQLPFYTDICQCPVCCKVFNSEAGYNMHRYGDYAKGRKCYSDAQMLKKGMSVNKQGRWITEAMPVLASGKIQGSTQQENSY